MEPAAKLLQIVGDPRAVYPRERDLESIRALWTLVQSSKSREPSVTGTPGADQPVQAKSRADWTANNSKLYW